MIRRDKISRRYNIMLERTWMACTYRPKVCLQHLHRSELSLKSPVQRAAEKAEKERKKK